MTQTEHCQDCGAQLHGIFCSECGQKSTQIHRSLWLLLREFFKEQFTMDAKLPKTLKPLLTAPGRLTTDYFEGKRTRYLPPLKLYLFISVVFFFLRTVVFAPDSAEILQNMEQSLNRTSDALIETVPVEDRDEMKEVFGDKNPVYSKFMKLHGEGKLAPFMVGFFSHGPTFMFVMMPLFAFFLRVVYLRHRENFFYFEHLIFALHFHAFMFLIMMLGIILPSLFIIKPMVLITLMIYLFLAMRRVYGQGKLKTYIKVVFLSVSYAFCFFTGMGVAMLYVLGKV